MEIYIPDVVKSLWEKLGSAIVVVPDESLKDHVAKLGRAIRKAYLVEDDRILPVLNNYHPDYISMSWSEIRRKGVSPEEAMDGAAYYYSFKGYDQVPEGNVDHEFEAILDIVLTGDLELIDEKLTVDPNLLTHRSKYGHEATLWHYLGSNGVELHRQVVPLNLPEIIELFLRKGVDRSMTMKVYGGDHRMKEMLATSAHPLEAGLQEMALDALERSASK